MPSKEHEALVEKVATVLNEQEGCYLQPQDYHRGAAKEVLSTIRAAVDESALHTLWTMGNCRMPFDKFKDRILLAFLAASALGEQSE